MNKTFEYKKSMSASEAIEADMKVIKAINEYRLQSLGKEGVETIVDRLNLEPFLEFLTFFNKSNDLPYHNFYHATCVFLNSYEGAHHSKLNDEDTRGLCAGALLHDINHSGGHLSDAENINIALEGLKNAQAYASSKLLGLSKRELEVAISVIKVTQYPFTITPTTIPQQIIRDADLMQPYEESDRVLIKQYIGLKDEIEIQRKITYTMSDFAVGLVQFQDTMEWHTEWAYEKAKVRGWELIKSRLKNLILEDDK